MELECIDVPAVDKLLNIGANSPAIRAEISEAISRAILDDLIANQ